MQYEKRERVSFRQGLGTAAQYILLTGVLSFLGWVYETVFVFVTTGRWRNQGFLTLPLCPIYGCSLLIVYFLLGTPDEGRGILKKVENPFQRYPLYLVFSFLIPTVAELAVGFFFDRFFDVWLWSYQDLPLNFRGYISLPVSLLWMMLIFLFMKYFFSYIKNAVFQIPKRTAFFFASFLVIAVVTDLVFSFLFL